MQRPRFEMQQGLRSGERPPAEVMHRKSEQCRERPHRSAMRHSFALPHYSATVPTSTRAFAYKSNTVRLIVWPETGQQIRTRRELSFPFTACFTTCRMCCSIRANHIKTTYATFASIFFQNSGPLATEVFNETLQPSGRFKKRVVTAIAPAPTFWRNGAVAAHRCPFEARDRQAPRRSGADSCPSLRHGSTDLVAKRSRRATAKMQSVNFA
jgi:hypothetical protein